MTNEERIEQLELQVKHLLETVAKLRKADRALSNRVGNLESASAKKAA